MRKIIVFDTASKPFLENRIFNQDVARRYFCTMLWVRIKEEGRRRGFDVMKGFYTIAVFVSLIV